MSSNLNQDQIDEIKKIYYDPKTGYGSAQKLKKKLGGKYTLKQIKSVLDSDVLYESTRNINEDFISDKQLKIAGDFGDWQSDLMFMPAKYKHFNHGYNTIICFISITTRRGFAYPVKSKKTNDMIVGLEYFIHDIDKIPAFDRPKNITVDAGQEYSKGVYEFLKKYDINLYTVNKSQSNSHATAIVERFNRTMRELIEQHLKATKNNNFIDALSELSANYNTSSHRTLDGKTPNEYTEEDAKKRMQEEKTHNQDVYKTVYHDFKVGDTVRVVSKKKAFDKGNKYKISDKVYTIESIDGNRFKLRNSKGKISKKDRFVYELIKSNANDTNIQQAGDELKTEDKKIKHQRRLKKEGLDLNREQIDAIMSK